MSDQGGTFGNFKVDQNGVTVSELTIKAEEDDLPASSTGGRLYGKQVAGATELHWRDEDGNVRRLTGPDVGSGAFARSYAPEAFAFGDGEALILSDTIPAGVFEVAATVWNDVTTADPATVYLRLRRRSDSALLLEILTTQTSKVELSPEDWTLAQTTAVDFYLVTSEATGVGYCSEIRIYTP